MQTQVHFSPASAKTPAPSSSSFSWCPHNKNKYNDSAETAAWHLMQDDPRQESPPGGKKLSSSASAACFHAFITGWDGERTKKTKKKDKQVKLQSTRRRRRRRRHSNVMGQHGGIRMSRECLASSRRRNKHRRIASCFKALFFPPASVSLWHYAGWVVKHCCLITTTGFECWHGSFLCWICTFSRYARVASTAAPQHARIIQHSNLPLVFT